MTAVVELLRVSTESQAGEDRAGLPAQHATNMRTCTLYGLQVIETVEIVESGTSVARSPQMRALLDLVEKGIVRGIVLAEYSRLFRPDRWGDMHVLEVLTDHGAKLYLPSGPIDLQSEPGFVQASVSNLVAGLELRRIKERMSRGKEEHRRRGAHVAGGCGIPFGLAYSKQNGWTYTADIERVRELFRLFLAGEHNYEELGRILGVPRSTARFLLTNPVYTGWRVYTEKRDPTPAGKQGGTLDRRKVKREEHEVIRVRLPLDPIVSEQEFALVQQIMGATRRRHLRTDRAHDFAYRGHLLCDCGSLVYCNVNRFKSDTLHYTYYCPSRRDLARKQGIEKCPTGFMRREKLEPVIDAAVKAHLLNPRFVANAIEDYFEAQARDWSTSEPDAGRVAGHLEELQRRRARVLDLYVDGSITKQERDARLVVVDRDTAAMQRLLSTPRPVRPDLPATELARAIASSFSRWGILGAERKLAVLDALGAQLHIGRYLVRGVQINNPSNTADLVGIARPTLYIPFRLVA